MNNKMIFETNDLGFGKSYIVENPDKELITAFLNALSIQYENKILEARKK